MRKLTDKDLHFFQLSREQHWVKFTVLNQEAVDSYLQQEEVKKSICGDLSQTNTLRLYFTQEKNERGDSVLTIGRSVGPNTFAFSANSTLANAVLTFVLTNDCNMSDKADIFTGLTRQPLSDYQPLIPSFAEGITFAEDKAAEVEAGAAAAAR